MFSDFSCHSQLHEEDPPVFQTQIMRSNYCICNVPDHVFQSPLVWKCIFMYWKETETYISYFLTVPLGDLILHLCLKIRYKITHPFLSHKLVKRTHKGTVEGWTTETGEYLWRTCLSPHFLVVTALCIISGRLSPLKGQTKMLYTLKAPHRAGCGNKSAIFYSCNGTVEEYWKIKPCYILCILVTLIDMSNICII